MAELEPHQLDEIAARLDEAEEHLVTLDERSQQIVGDVRDCLNAMHASALTTIVRTLKADPRGKELLFDLVDEPGVRMALAMHGLIRPDPLTQATRVIEAIRPALAAEGAGIELVSLADAVAVLRLPGAEKGCSSGALKAAVQDALLQGVSGLQAVEIEAPASAPVLIPLTQLGVGAPR